MPSPVIKFPAGAATVFAGDAADGWVLTGSEQAETSAAQVIMPNSGFLNEVNCLLSIVTFPYIELLLFQVPGWVPARQSSS
jgi:hypothetical protein